MRIADAVVVVTGAGSGIGAELARRFVAEGARAVVLADRNLAAVETVAAGLGDRATARALDVTDEAAVAALVAEMLAKHGRIDLFCSNAGLGTGTGLYDAPDSNAWQQAWDVHVMAHVYAARAVLPAMIAEWRRLPAQHRVGRRAAQRAGRRPVHRQQARRGGAGRVAGLQLPRAEHPGQRAVPDGGGHPAADRRPGCRLARRRRGRRVRAVLGVEQVADAVVEALDRETFLILPHPQVGKFWATKAADVDGWLTAMAGLAGASGAVAGGHELDGQKER